MGVIHLGPLSALPGTCIVLCALAMLYDPGGTCTVLAYRPAHYCLRPKLEYRLPLVVLTRLNRFTLSHYGSRTPLSTLHAGLTASHARLSTGCLLGFAGSGLSPDYTIHAELAHNFRTLTPAGCQSSCWWEQGFPLSHIPRKKAKHDASPFYFLYYHPLFCYSSILPYILSDFHASLLLY